MEIYSAISDFVSPSGEGSQNILSFSKGDRFEIFDCHKTTTDWWGARALSDNSVGYVPSKYLKFEDRHIGSVLPDDYKSTKEESLKRLSAMQNMEDKQSQESGATPVTPDTPIPDYDEADFSDDTPQAKHIKFVHRFSSILSSIKSIDEMYPDIPEPAPDYYDADDDITDSRNNHNQINSQKSQLSSSMIESVVFRERKESNPELEKRLSDPGNDDLLIKPKKLANPCLVSPARLAVHKELLHNYKLGKNILEKPELNKVLEQRKEKQRIQEWESQKKLSNKRTSLEMKLEHQANRLKEQEVQMNPITENEDRNQSELSKVQAKILSKSSKEGMVQ